MGQIWTLALAFWMFWFPQYTVPLARQNTAVSGSFGSLTQYESSLPFATGTTAAISNVTLAAGDVMVITVQTGANANIVITSVTGQNCVRTNTWSNGTFNGSSDQCVILHASAITNATLTINFSATTGGGIANLRRYAVVSGTPALDAVNSFNQASASSITNVPLTVSGTNAVVVVGEPSYYGCASSSFVSSPWTDGTYLASGSPDLTMCTADQINVASVTTPTWSGSGMYATDGVAISFGPTASVQWGFNDGSGGTSGVQPTAATLAASLWGAPLAGANYLNWIYVVNDASSMLTYKGATGDACTNAYHGLHNAAPRFFYGNPLNTAYPSGGVTYANVNQLGFKFTASGTNTSGFQFEFPDRGGNNGLFTQPTITVSADFCTPTLSTDNTGGDIHFFNTYDTSNGNTNPGLFANGTILGIECAVDEGTCLNGLNSGVAAVTTISSGTWYHISTQLNTLWAKQSPTSPLSLTIGSNTISIAPCPFNINMPFYIAGTGTAEFVQPTSTTCTSLGSSGTITVTVVGAHSAGYTLEAADPVTIKNDSGTIIGMEYYEEEGTAGAYSFRLGLPGIGSLPSGKSLYFSNPAMCYATILPAICPTDIRP